MSILRLRRHSSHFLSFSAAFVLLIATAARAADVSGSLESQLLVDGKPVDYRLTGDATFGWKFGVVTGDVDLNGHTLTMETGGGNVTEFRGVICGEGAFIWNGGGADVWQTRASYFSGRGANTFTGPLTILRGTLAFAKPRGVAALGGRLIILGGGSNQAILQLNADEQVPDDCTLRISGEHDGRLWTRGHRETLGSLELQAHGSIDLGHGASVVSFGPSADAKWNLERTLTITGWTAGKDKVIFRDGEKALTRAQLARIGFADPSDKPAGLYTAKLGDGGELLPDRRVEAKDPPFDVSDEARAKRKAIYEVKGRDLLSGGAGNQSPLRDGMSISFFGDSITWQNAYIARIGKAIAGGAGTRGKKIALHNRGINGGGVLSVRDGVEKAAYVDAEHQDGPQASFAEVIAKDKADVAVVFIGVNDVWWRDTPPADFEKAMRDLIDPARRNKTMLVLATLAVIEEMPDGSNPRDKALDQYAELTRKVAKDTGATLVDVRGVFMAYLRNHNATLRVDGSIVMQKSGVLTYDGVHPSDEGNDLLADHIAAGIARALQAKNGE